MKAVKGPRQLIVPADWPATTDPAVLNPYMRARYPDARLPTPEELTALIREWASPAPGLDTRWFWAYVPCPKPELVRDPPEGGLIPWPDGWVAKQLTPLGYYAVDHRGVKGGLRVGVDARWEAAPETGAHRRWLHLTVSRYRQMPTYEELQRVKHLFTGADLYGVEIYPPAARHINIAPTCRHLWLPVGHQALPDFTHGWDVI